MNDLVNTNWGIVPIENMGWLSGEGESGGGADADGKDAEWRWCDGDGVLDGTH